MLSLLVPNDYDHAHVVASWMYDVPKLEESCDNAHDNIIAGHLKGLNISKVKSPVNP